MRTEAAFPSDARDFRICETDLVSERWQRRERNSPPTVCVEEPIGEVFNALIKTPFRELLQFMTGHSRCQFTIERDHSVSRRALRHLRGHGGSSEFFLQPAWCQPGDICQPGGAYGFRLLAVRRCLVEAMPGFIHLGYAPSAEMNASRSLDRLHGVQTSLRFSETLP